MNIALTRAADGLARRAFTVEDIRRMVEAGVIGEDERIELVEGDLVMMAAKGYPHEIVKQALNKALVTAAPDDVMWKRHFNLPTVSCSNLTWRSFHDIVGPNPMPDSSPWIGVGASF